MHCFTHQGETAVGVCIVCGRGVCRDCAKIVGGAVACLDRCEFRVERLMEYRAWTMVQPAIYRSNLRAGRVRWLTLGSVLLMVGGIVLWKGLIAEDLTSSSHGVLALLGGWAAVLLGLAFNIDNARLVPLCPVCKYNLNGVEGPVCPECGERLSS